MCIKQCLSSQSIFYDYTVKKNETVKCATLAPPLGARPARTATFAPSGHYGMGGISDASRRPTRLFIRRTVEIT